MSRRNSTIAAALILAALAWGCDQGDDASVRVAVDTVPVMTITAFPHAQPGADTQWMFPPGGSLAPLHGFRYYFEVEIRNPLGKPLPLSGSHAFVSGAGNMLHIVLLNMAETIPPYQSTKLRFDTDGYTEQLLSSGEPPQLIVVVDGIALAASFPRMPDLMEGARSELTYTEVSVVPDLTSATPAKLGRGEWLRYFRESPPAVMRKQGQQMSLFFFYPERENDSFPRGPLGQLAGRRGDIWADLAKIGLDRDSKLQPVVESTPSVR